MSLKPVLIQLDKLASISSTNDRTKELGKCLDDPIFRKVVQYAYNQGWSYSVKDVDFIASSTATDINKIFDQLDFLRSKGSANNNDKTKLGWLSSIDEETAIVVSRICKHDLRGGFSFKTINKAKKGIVEEVPYQRCSTEDSIERVTYPAIVQKKADGMFSYAFPWKDSDVFVTRYGNTYDLFGFIKDELLQIIGNEKLVTVGECLVINEKGEVLDRKTGNGIMNRFIQGTGTKEEAERVIYVIWDIIPYDDYLNRFCSMSYGVRFPKIKDMIDKWAKVYYPVGFAPVEVIPYEVVHNVKEAKAFYKKMRDLGFEGAVLKDLSEIWKPTTSKKFVKMKNKAFAEFEIVEALYGNKGTKFENLLGSLVIKTCDGKIVTEVGSGFDQKDRELGIDWWNSQKGKIITVSFESVIDDKTNRKTKKLFLPAFEETRFNEKYEADTAEYCINQCKPKK